MINLINCSDVIEVLGSLNRSSRIFPTVTISWVSDSMHSSCVRRTVAFLGYQSFFLQKNTCMKRKRHQCLCTPCGLNLR